MKKSMSSIYSFLNKEDTYTKLNTLKEKYPNATIIVKKIYTQYSQTKLTFLILKKKYSAKTLQNYT
jgi:phage/plasmid-associated DNA primase